MLVLTRKIGESIIVDTPQGLIAVTVVDVKSPVRVSLGIEADAAIPIHREEVFDGINRNRLYNPDPN